MQGWEESPAWFSSSHPWQLPASWLWFLSPAPELAATHKMVQLWPVQNDPGANSLPCWYVSVLSLIYKESILILTNFRLLQCRSTHSGGTLFIVIVEKEAFPRQEASPVSDADSRIRAVVPLKCLSWAHPHCRCLHLVRQALPWLTVSIWIITVLSLFFRVQIFCSCPALLLKVHWFSLGVSDLMQQQISNQTWPCRFYFYLLLIFSFMTSGKRDKWALFSLFASTF